jgi:cytochrome b involved in lipid metabolism|tara:strand:+ start:348 stop:575 length:228 start_codon:yes stop_codon:yes gene_type:complete
MDIKNLIVFHNNKTYDITDFIELHPGGNIIKNAHNKNLIDVWNDFGVEFHINDEQIFSILEKYIITDSIILNHNT